jgi:hypothetical protein
MEILEKASLASNQSLIWSPGMSVGHPLIDEQHKKLLSLIQASLNAQTIAGAITPH